MHGDELETALESLGSETEERTAPAADGARATGAASAEGLERAPEPATALVVSCSMSRCEHGGGLWPVEPSWTVTGVTTLGNQTWKRTDGGTTLDGDLAHLVAETDVGAVLVVGHTDCDVVADAHERYVAPAPDEPAGITTRLHPLVSVVGDAFEAGLVDDATPLRTARHRLVEYNVHRQVARLERELPESVTTAGYVRDQDGAYGTFPGGHYLVRLDGERGADIAPDRPRGAGPRTASLLR